MVRSDLNLSFSSSLLTPMLILHFHFVKLPSGNRPKSFEYRSTIASPSGTPGAVNVTELELNTPNLLRSRLPFASSGRIDSVNRPSASVVVDEAKDATS